MTPSQPSGRPGKRHGDTFAVSSGGDRYLFTFSPAGVQKTEACSRASWTRGPTNRPRSDAANRPGRQPHSHRLADTAALHSPMLVTAFGHGRHSCPAQPFSLAAMTTAMVRLLTAFEIAPAWEHPPTPVPAQIGGVARAADACPIRYCARP
jgi:hypothetical protein